MLIVKFIEYDPLAVVLRSLCGHAIRDRYFSAIVLLLRQIEKVPRGIQGGKSSKDMASSRNLVSIIGAKAKPKRGNGTRCPEG